ncbi:hypothetical protein HYC85_001675 [Camellia sinensis]|uniref:Uncharacterized protein n=1 Tax=Camellia sinensis TaxID=4442 RepID=A0A7J7I7G7_CAMSI|nr:hypothetical protein HYC85_001675 [Camellia sinensis]
MEFEDDVYQVAPCFIRHSNKKKDPKCQKFPFTKKGKEKERKSCLRIDRNSKVTVVF